MATDKIEIQQDSEFITNLVAAKPIAATNHFISVLDANAAPAVFSLSTDGELLLISQDPTDEQGGYDTTDFGALCGVTSKISAFAIRQTADKMIFVAMAVENGPLSTLLILPQLSPERLLSPPVEQILGKNSSFPQTKLLFLVSLLLSGAPYCVINAMKSVDVGDSDHVLFALEHGDYNDVKVGEVWYPKIVLSYQAIDRIGGEHDIGIVNIDANTGLLSLDKTFYLPANPKRILDIEFCKSRIGHGIAFLYEAQDQIILMYVTYDGSGFSCKPKTPPGAQCLEAFVDPKTGLSSLIIGANGLFLFDYKQYTNPQSSGTSISTDLNVIVGITDLDIVSHNEFLSVWFTNKDKAVGYFTTTAAAVTSGSLTMLLATGSADQISGLLCFPKGSKADSEPVNCLVCVKNEKDLQLLQQSTAGGIWQTYPMIVTSAAHNLEVASFTTRLSLKPHRSRSAAFASVHLKCSGHLDAFVNGAATKLSEHGDYYAADASGELTLIVATADLSAATMEIDGVLDAEGKAFTIDEPVRVMPASKVFAQLDQLSTVEGLKAARLRNKDLLIDEKVVDEKDIKEAAKAMGAFKEQAKKIDDGTSLKSIHHNGVNGAGPGQAPRLLAGTMTLQRRKQLLQDNGDVISPSEAWYWLCEKAKEAGEWALTQIGDFIHFTIHLAGQLFDFIINEFPALGSALTWVMSKLQVAWNKIREFFEFYFDWDDILATKRQISSFFSSSLKYFAQQTSGLAEKVHQNIEKLREDVKEQAVQPNVTTAIDQQEDPKVTETKKGVGYNWGTYQLTKAGGVDKVKFKDAAGPVEPWEAGWELLASTLTSTADLVDTVGNDLLDLIKSSDSTTTNTALAKLQVDAQDKALGVLDSIVTGILRLVESIITWIESQATEALEIPIFTKLYAYITKGDTLSVLDLMSLLLAIPVTLLSKAITGAKPPLLNGGNITVDYIASIFDQSLPDKASNDLNTVSNLACIATSGLGMYFSNISFVLEFVTPTLKQQGRGGPKVQDAPKFLVEQFDKINVVVGIVGAVFSSPLWGSHSAVTPWIGYTIWSGTILRQLIAVVKLVVESKKNISLNANKVIAGVQLTIQIPVSILQCIAAKQQNNDDTDREIAIATLTLLATAGKSIGKILEKTPPPQRLGAVVAQGSAIALTYFGVIPLQVESTVYHVQNDVQVQPNSTA